MFRGFTKDIFPDSKCCCSRENGICNNEEKRESNAVSHILCRDCMVGKVDMISACISITNERAKNVLFFAPYYTGGIAAQVKE